MMASAAYPVHVLQTCWTVLGWYDFHVCYAPGACACSSLDLSHEPFLQHHQSHSRYAQAKVVKSAVMPVFLASGRQLPVLPFIYAAFPLYYIIHGVCQGTLLSQRHCCSHAQKAAYLVLV